MKKLQEMMDKQYIKVSNSLVRFMESERGDTNFVSMMIIIGIVVVLAGLFLTLGRGVMTSITNKVTTFINSL